MHAVPTAIYLTTTARYDHSEITKHSCLDAACKHACSCHRRILPVAVTYDNCKITEQSSLYYDCKHAYNKRACIRHQCRKAAVLSCHRCLINTGVEKMNDI